MKVFRGFDEASGIPRAAVTVGSFDGVHLGHCELLRHVRECAARSGGQSVVVTFDPHPRQILRGGNGIELLTTTAEKALLLEHEDIDNLVIVPFTPEFSALSSYDFVKDLLHGRLGVATLVAGYNHHFGRSKEGNAQSLAAMGLELGFDVYTVPRLDAGAEKVSSTAIRNLIAAGDMTGAAGLLGHPYIILADVRGGVAGPCAAEKLLPPPGSYRISTLRPGDGLSDSDCVPKHTLTIDNARNLTVSPPLAADEPTALLFM